MKNTLPQFSNLQNLSVTSDTAKNLQPAMCWAKIISIFGFVTSGVSFAISISLLFLLETLLGPVGWIYRGQLLFAVIFCLSFTVCYFIANLNLFNAASNIRKAIISGDNATLSTGARNLKRHFMLYGIITIAAWIFSILYLLFTFIYFFSY